MKTYTSVWYHSKLGKHLFRDEVGKSSELKQNRLVFAEINAKT